MYTLLKVSKAEANKGIYHTRANGDFVEELFRKDADLVYEVTERNNYFGNKYAFFIIEVERGDKIKCAGQNRFIDTVPYFEEYSVYRGSCEVNEMCYQLVKQNKPLPEKIENLLKDKLSIFFMQPISWETKGYDSNAVWENYEGILKYLGKNANEFVPQEKIDGFILSLIEKYELRQVEKISRSKFIDISLENIEKYVNVKERLNATIAIAKELVSQAGYKDIKYTIGGDRRVLISAKDTPCGEIGIKIILEYGEMFVLLYVTTADGYFESDAIDISKECQEYKENFMKK